MRTGFVFSITISNGEILMMSFTVNNTALMMILLIHRTDSNKASLYPVSQGAAEE